MDELLAQFDQDRKASYPVQDAGGDVISLIDLGGGGGGTARTVANIVYDAYGRVIAHEHLWPHAYLRTGHMGLFFDRLDAGVADGTTYEETPRLVSGSTLLGQNRNRTLNTSWGRFLQSDPNATGVAVMASLSFHGRGMAAFVDDFNLNGSYGDGANLYIYLQDEPWTKHDPTGLVALTLDLPLSAMGRAPIAAAAATFMNVVNATGGLATWIAAATSMTVVYIGGANGHLYQAPDAYTVQGMSGYLQPRGELADDEWELTANASTIKAPGIPTSADGYEPPKRGLGSKGELVANPNGPQRGYLDKYGNVWVPTGEGPQAHGGPHWDVQRPDGSHSNVYPGGRAR